MWEVFDEPYKTVEKQDTRPTIEPNFQARAATKEDDLMLWEGGPKKLVPTKKTLLHNTKYFPGIPQHVIQKTFQSTTQYSQIEGIMGSVVQSRIRAPNPALNIPRHRNQNRCRIWTIFGSNCHQWLYMCNCVYWKEVLFQSDSPKWTF
jgi:hypothetical protein